MKPNGIELQLGINEYREDLDKAAQVSSISRLVACFGGSSIYSETGYERDATKLACKLAKAGIKIITGGGDGIMNAANKGAYEESPETSYGLRVNTIKGLINKDSSVIDNSNLFDYNTLSVRLLTLISSSDAVVFFPGGFGTLEEMFSLLVRVKLGMMKRIPIYFYSSIFWTGLYNWLMTSVMQVGAIQQCDMELMTIEDSIDEIADKIIKKIT